MTMTTVTRTCPVCFNDREWMIAALQEDYVWESWPRNGGTFFRTVNHQNALIIMNKCKRCYRDLKHLLER